MACLLPYPSSLGHNHLISDLSPPRPSSLFPSHHQPILPTRIFQLRSHSETRGYHVLRCRCSSVKESPPSNPSTLIAEPHKYFDQVIITVRSGDGGHGAVLTMPSPKVTSKSHGKHVEEKSKKKPLYKRDSDGSLILPMGGHGGDVVIYADESEDSLLEFHRKSRYNAKRGGNVDAMGVLTSQMHDGFASPTLRIPVPVGTVVKRKRGKFLADLARPGDEILVARGGQGGLVKKTMKQLYTEGL